MDQFNPEKSRNVESGPDLTPESFEAQEAGFRHKIRPETPAERSERIIQFPEPGNKTGKAAAVEELKKAEPLTPEQAKQNFINWFKTPGRFAEKANFIHDQLEGTDDPTNQIAA